MSQKDMGTSVFRVKWPQYISTQMISIQLMSQKLLDSGMFIAN